MWDVSPKARLARMRQRWQAKLPSDVPADPPPLTALSGQRRGLDAGPVIDKYIT